MTETFFPTVITIMKTLTHPVPLFLPEDKPVKINPIIAREKYDSVYFWQPVWRAAGFIVLVPLTIMLLAGGILFWLPKAPVISARENDATPIQVAQTGLSTMKRMVGDDQAWASAIEQEYKQTHISDASIAVCNPYNDTFVSSVR